MEQGYQQPPPSPTPMKQHQRAWDKPHIEATQQALLNSATGLITRSSKMATRWRFLIACLWIFLTICRMSASIRTPSDANSDLLFAPRRLMSNGKSSAICAWRRSSHLRPHLRRSRSYSATIPCTYWLLLIAGDVEINPGPIRFPCTVCQKPVRTNQRGVCCDACDLWTHASCARVGNEEYAKLSSECDLEWLCPTCVLANLPFPDLNQCCTDEHPSTDNNSHLDVSATEATVSSDDDCGEAVEGGEPLHSIWECKQGLLVSHLNVRSLASKFDQIKFLLGNQTRTNMVFGISEMA